MTAIVVQINVSPGGMPKLPVAEGRVGPLGLEGDSHLNKKFHGGPKRAVCLYSTELYDWLNEQGVQVGPGDLGENFTTLGLDLQKLEPGLQLRIGGDDGVLLGITGVRTPCSKLKKWDADLPELIVGRSGWMAKVVREGTVRPGDVIEVLSAPEPGV